MRWFRFYNETRHDPKVQRLPAELFRAWVNMLCLANENGGHIPGTPEDLAYEMRMPVAKAMKCIEQLKHAGLLDQDETLHPHNWNGRQYQSDDVGTRVKRYRERQRNVTETADETPPDTDTESDTEQKQRGEEAAAVSDWHALAEEHDLRKVAKLTKTRRSHLKARLSDCGGLDGWRSALAKIRGSPFMLGKNDRGWKIDFDFLVSESGFTKLMEGKYDGGSRVQGGKKSGGATGWAAVALEQIGGFDIGGMEPGGEPVDGTNNAGCEAGATGSGTVIEASYTRGDEAMADLARHAHRRPNVG
jgi:hypothetical protein